LNLGLLISTTKPLTGHGTMEWTISICKVISKTGSGPGGGLVGWWVGSKKGTLL